MEQNVQQLVEMGATPAQARAALKKCKDVMDAAEKIFSGEFDNVEETDGDVEMKDAPRAKVVARPATPDDDQDDDDDSDAIPQDDDEDGDDDDAYADDYDSDYEEKAKLGKEGAKSVDPYAGIFFSKSRKEEVIEVEEEPEYVTLPGRAQKLLLMSSGEWMKGCPEGGEQGFLFSLYNQLTFGSIPCPNNCGSQLPRSKADFFAIFPTFTEYTEYIKATVGKSCPKCKQEICGACGEALHLNEKKRSGQAPYDPLFHCSGLQGILLGVGLFMLERMFLEQMSSPPSAAATASSKKRKVTTIGTGTPDEDDIYPRHTTKKPKNGIGYDGNVKEDTSGQLEAYAQQNTRDEQIGSLMRQIREFLPSVQRPHGGHASDFLPHPTALAHLRRRFNFVSSSLLRNDSLTDMSDRSVLYFELFSWLETISNHEALASMVAMPIMIASSSKAVPPRPGSSNSRERIIIYEGSSGPRELMESLVIQATAAIKGLEGSRSPPENEEEMTEEQKRVTNENRSDKGKGKEKNSISEENAKLLSFCDRILATARAIDRSLRETKGDAFVDRMHKSLPKISSQSKSSDDTEVQAPIVIDDSATLEEAMKTYEEWATRVRFEYCDLTVAPAPEVLAARAKNAQEGIVPEEDLPNYMHAYNTEARLLTNSDIPKRSLAIAKELAVLTTNLPVAWNSSVFLRVDETRVDVIKALITGPEGTPYHNGCFLFDIFLGASYNSAPPSVKYMTTNNGRFRFNPNLYADGKVCLSLLGTWSGPGWISGKSTLLQVLISIQSMILCEEPYLNEPGWANDGGSPQSMAYSANVRRMVVNTAMLGILKNPPEPFGDIIRTHFRLKAKTISEQLDDWLRRDDGKQTNGQGSGYSTSGPNGAGGSGNGFRKDVEEMKGLLLALKNGETIGAGPSSSS
ncbi:hypothetical protein FRC03_003913 [Tulasnella sp. 419]|nr:hypothetical protein FRC03_003913 [Tulasnella sp. 419]